MDVITVSRLRLFFKQIQDVFAKTNHTHTVEDITDFTGSSTDVLRFIYPVGSIYISASDKSPSELFGFGEWEQIKDTFLLSAGDDHYAGETGGESEHILTVDEMPSHNHKFKTDLDNDFNVSWEPWTEWTSGWTQYPITTSSAPTGTTFVGGGKSHNNMPPYLAVYMWKRIA